MSAPHWFLDQMRQQGDLMSGFKVTRTAAGYHVTLHAANGEIVMTSETFTRREAAEDNIGVVMGLCAKFHVAGHTPITFADNRTAEQ